MSQVHLPELYINGYFHLIIHLVGGGFGPTKSKSIVFHSGSGSGEVLVILLL